MTIEKQIEFNVLVGESYEKADKLRPDAPKKNLNSTPTKRTGGAADMMPKRNTSRT